MRILHTLDQNIVQSTVFRFISTLVHHQFQTVHCWKLFSWMISRQNICNIHDEQHRYNECKLKIKYGKLLLQKFQSNISYPSAATNTCVFYANLYWKKWICCDFSSSLLCCSSRFIISICIHSSSYSVSIYQRPSILVCSFGLHRILLCFLLKLSCSSQYQVNRFSQTFWNW